MKRTTCYSCGTFLDIGDQAVIYNDEVYCDDDCVIDWIKQDIEEIEIEESHCENYD